MINDIVDKFIFLAIRRLTQKSKFEGCHEQKVAGKH